jgi:hypothetical protein
LEVDEPAETCEIGFIRSQVVLLTGELRDDPLHLLQADVSYNIHPIPGHSLSKDILLVLNLGWFLL